jgi:hypothetical protein
MAAEAAEFTERKRIANQLAGTRHMGNPETARGSKLGRDHGSNLEVQRERVEARLRCLTEAEHLRVDRDECGRCGVRKDKHEQAGCPKWRAKA